METTESRIRAALDKVVNVQLQMHGGGVALTQYEDGIAWVKFLGACAGCMSVSDTLELVVKEAIMEAAPEVKDVRQDTGVSEDLLETARRILRGEKP